MKHRLFILIPLCCGLWSCQNVSEKTTPDTPLETYFRLDSTIIGVSVIASGLDVPWEITWGPGDWIWLTEQKGIVSKINPANGKKIEMLRLKDVYLRTTPGLMGMAVRPDPERFPYVFLLYNSKKDANTIVLNLVRYKVRQDTLTDPLLLLEIPGGKGHNGSRVTISPDGKLVIATGEGTKGGRAQDRSSLGGKILRINIDGTIPADNPFPGSAVWSMGHRNQQGLVYGRNDMLYTSEHGEATDDEINIIQKGRNYGWPHVEGYCDREAEMDFCSDSSVAEPLKAWTPTIAPAGLDYYSSGKIPEWKNTLLLTTLKDASLHALHLDPAGRKVMKEEVFLKKIYGRLRDLCISPEGDIYISTSNRDWNPPPGFPGKNDDRILRLFKVTDTAKLKDIRPLSELTRSLQADTAGLSGGELLYQQYCSSCHKPNGKGVPGVFPPLTGTPTILENEEKLTTSVLRGISGPLEVKGQEYDGEMPGFHTLSDAEIAKILSFIRSHFGNNAGKIPAEQVGKVRKKLGLPLQQ